MLLRRGDVKSLNVVPAVVYLRIVLQDLVLKASNKLISCDTGMWQLETHVEFSNAFVEHADLPQEFSKEIRVRTILSQLSGKPLLTYRSY